VPENAPVYRADMGEGAPPPARAVRVPMTIILHTTCQSVPESGRVVKAQTLPFVMRTSTLKPSPFSHAYLSGLPRPLALD
jgi:hypothetical protein